MEKKELTDKDILNLLSEVNDKLHERGKSASILLSGGASMSLLFSRDRVTQDVDAVLLSSDRSEFRNVVSEVGTENGLKEDWLNDAVKGYIDFNWQREFIPIGLSNLTVYSVPADKLLAMKLSSGRSYSKDREDAIELMKHLDIRSPKEALEILEDAVPEQLLTAKTRYFTMETFNEYSEKYHIEEPRLEHKNEEMEIEF